MRQVRRFLAAVGVGSFAATTAAFGGITNRTGEDPMMVGNNGFSTTALLTVGESVDDGNGGAYQFTGIPDGIGAMLLDDLTVRIFLNHEFGAGQGAPWELQNGTVIDAGGRVSYFDIDIPTRTIVRGNLAISGIIDWQGREMDEDNKDEFGQLDRPCSSALFGEAEGFADNIYFFGEETEGGRMWALDVATGAAYELGDFGNGAWENSTVIPTGGTTAEAYTVMLLADDSQGRPAYLYVGLKEEGGDFLSRNGLIGGQLYAFVLDSGANTNTEFNGTGNTEPGRWERLSANDPTRDNTENMNAIVAEAGALGAFFFSRPEDLAYNPLDPASGGVVFVSTGREADLGDIDGDGESDILADPWGTSYIITTDLETIGGGGAGVIQGAIEIIFDGNEKDKRDFGIRSPDNLDWADDGYVYIQEDRSVNGFGADSGREASIWRIDPDTYNILHVAVIDRSAVPTGTTDSAPTDLGNWESSGILDISAFFGEAPGTLHVIDIQAHSIRDGIIAEDNLVQGGQLLLLDSGKTLANESLDVLIGNVVEGDIESVRNSDNDHLRVRPTFIQNRPDAFNVLIQLTAFMVNELDAGAISIQFEGRNLGFASAGVAMLLNHNTGMFDEIAEFAFYGSDDTIVINGVPGDDYIGTNNSVVFQIGLTQSTLAGLGNDQVWFDKIELRVD